MSQSSTPHSVNAALQQSVVGWAPEPVTLHCAKICSKCGQAQARGLLSACSREGACAERVWLAYLEAI